MDRLVDASRLVDVVKQRLAGAAIDQIGPAIAAGAILVNGRPGAINQLVAPDDVLAVNAANRGALGDLLVPEPRALRVLVEDDDLLVVDKPAGVHVHPLGPHRTGTLLNALLWYAGARPDQPWAAWRPRPAHRLDRGARGLLVIAKRAEIHDALRAMLEAHAIDRGYRATVHGHLAAEAGTIDAPLGRDPTNDYRRAVIAGGQRAITHFRVVARAPGTTELALTLATGRTHQIRAHLASLGHPIVGDTLYGAPPGAAGHEIALCAVSLRFAHPRTRAAITVERQP
ncbi:MAG TPA: RluA family pseudouridine synthase [Kofleriaceae bacterium]|nr:RluA family pseudouridine synthase [Kofleriaceae bacterium]